jgi:hypothetical protein
VNDTADIIRAIEFAANMGINVELTTAEAETLIKEIERLRNMEGEATPETDGLLSYSMLEDLLRDVSETATFKDQRTIDAWNAALKEMFRMHRIVRRIRGDRDALEDRVREYETLLWLLRETGFSAETDEFGRPYLHSRDCNHYTSRDAWEARKKDGAK